MKDPVLGYGPKGSELKSTNLAKVAMQHSIQPSSHSMPFMADQREGSPTRESPGRSRRGPSRPYANLYAGYSSGPSKTTAKLNPTAARDGW